MKLVRRSAGALALVLLVGGPGPAPAFAQNERPDLAIEVLGLKAGSLREVRVRVTNVGQWWADRTSATVETVAPTAGNQDTEQIPDTGPKGDKETASEYEFIYKLAADCDGHTVKASLKPAKTFNGNLESNLGNNTAGPVKVCEAKAAPKPQPPLTQSGGIVVSPVGPVAEKPITETRIHVPARSFRTDEIPSNFFRPYGLYREDPGLWFVCEDAHRKTVELNVPGDTHVGFAYHDFAGCEINRVYQLIVNFDLSWLREAEAEVTRATLVLQEQVFAARNEAGETITAETCVETVGVAPRNYTEKIERQEILESAHIQREWVGNSLDVTPEIRAATASPDAVFYGFIFHGFDENLDADSDAMCVSHIRNIRLKLEFTVPK